MAGDTQEAYGRLCAEYYDLDKPQAHPVALRFYMSRARAAGGPILEPMVGTGSFLLPMLAEGLDVRGFDLSPHMLAILKRKARGAGLSPNCWKGGIADLPQPGTYRLVFIPNGSINLLVGEGECFAALTAFFGSLASGGKLVFDLETESTHSMREHAEPWIGQVSRPGGRVIRLTTVPMEEDPEIETTLCRYEVLKGDHVEEAESEVFRLRYFPRRLMEKWLAQVGFREVRFLRQHSEEEAGENDGPVLTVEATKP